MDQYLERIKEIVFKEKYILRPNHLITLFDLHIRQSQYLLELFANQYKNDLVIKYGLLGHQDEETDEVGARRYVTVDLEDLESEKKNFNKLLSCTIKLVKEKQNVLNTDYPIEKIVKSKDDLIKYQKKGFCVNENSELRTDKLDELMKRLGVNKSTNKILSTQNFPKFKPTNSSEIKEESKLAIEAINPEIKSKDVFSSFKNRPKEQTKPKEILNDIKKDYDENEKNHAKKDEEFVKLKNNKSIKKEDRNDHNEINDIEMNNEEEQVYSKNSKQMKRSKIFDSDSDDEDLGHLKENLKHKNKKQRRRVIDFDDSSEESNDFKNGTIDSKFENIKNINKEITSSQLIDEEETFLDEDGFKVHRMIKKIVKDNKNDKSSAKNETKKNENATSNSKKPIVKLVTKNQTSIMSFFKPKNQS